MIQDIKLVIHHIWDPLINYLLIVMHILIKILILNFLKLIIMPLNILHYFIILSHLFIYTIINILHQS